jgi:hypothetical protein
MLVNCPRCEASYDVPANLAGLPITCWNCDESFSVPEPPAAERTLALLWIASHHRTLLLVVAAIFIVGGAIVGGLRFLHTRRIRADAAARVRFMRRALEPWATPERPLELLCQEVNRSRSDQGLSLPNAVRLQIAVEQSGTHDARDMLAQYTAATAIAVEGTRDPNGELSEANPEYFHPQHIPFQAAVLTPRTTLEKMEIKADFRGHFIVWSLRAQELLSQDECRAAAFAIIRRSPPDCHYTQFWVGILPPEKRCVVSCYTLMVQAPDGGLWRPYEQYVIDQEQYQAEMFDPPEWALE